jgi:hypothetical protein
MKLYLFIYFCSPIYETISLLFERSPGYVRLSSVNKNSEGEDDMESLWNSNDRAKLKF